MIEVVRYVAIFFLFAGASGAVVLFRPQIRTGDGSGKGPAASFPGCGSARSDGRRPAVCLSARAFWDDLDFADTVFIVSTDTIHMLRAFDTYIRNFVMESDPSPVAELMRKASGSKTMLEYFAMLAERVLHDPNSPLHSDELYIPVLEALVASPWLDEWEKIAPEHDLRMALQNRVGLPANDFRYTLASGRTGTLYGIRADYTLVFFNNPDCGMCERIRAEIVASPLLSEMIRAGRLEVLALYPDEDLTAWRAHAPQVPSLWINAYDAGARISKEELYDLKAIPSMYLLDRDKRVLAKDAFEVGYIEWLLDRQPQ